MLMIHKPKIQSYDTTTIRTSSDSHLLWKNHSHKNPLYFGIYADFESDNEVDTSSIGNKTTNVYKQMPILNGYHIESESDDVLKSAYYESLVGYNIVDWFVDEIIKLEKKLNFYVKNTEKDIIMTEEDEENFENNICRFCEKEKLSHKVHDHCHVTSKYRGPAQNRCNINVTKDQSIFITIIFHNLNNYDGHQFFKELVDRKNDKVNLKIIPETNEEYISVRYACIKFINGYRILSSWLAKLVKTLDDNSHRTLKILKEECVDNDEIMNNVNGIGEENRTVEDLEKDNSDENIKLEEALLNYLWKNEFWKQNFPIISGKIWLKNKHIHMNISISLMIIENLLLTLSNLKREHFFSKLKNKCPDDEEIQRTKKGIKLFNIKSGEQLSRLCLKGDVLIPTFVFDKFMKVSFNEFGINPLYCVTLPGYTWQGGLKYTWINLQTLQAKNLLLKLEIKIRGGLSTNMGDRYVKSDENKKILCIDATNWYGHSMSQVLPYDEIEMWHGHPDLYKNNLEEISNTPDDSDIGCFPWSWFTIS